GSREAGGRRPGLAQLWRRRADPAGYWRARHDRDEFDPPQPDRAGRLWSAHCRLARHGRRRPIVSEPIRVLIVEARFYDDLADALLDGAKDALRAQGAEFDVVSVPGALEVPTAIAMAEEAGRFPTAPRYDGYVALGCVIRGETYHFEIVSDQSAAGLRNLGLKGVAVGNGILTTEDEDQAWARARISEGDKGGGAARACLDLIALRKRLRVGLGS